jgi:hypothetical protein
MGDKTITNAKNVIPLKKDVCPHREKERERKKKKSLNLKFFMQPFRDRKKKESKGQFCC